MANLGIWPSQLKPQIRGVDLNDQQFDEFSMVAGRLVKFGLTSLVNKPEFEMLPEGMQRKKMTAMISNMRHKASNYILLKNPDLMVQAKKNKIEDEYGIDLDEESGEEK